ncbi:MAG: hypothetical protein CTY20_00850 [Hyphomicrobium sp.]|nr:MAG: hypothetical protein CTY20_00850 [Hyphomicrobium sp.]
MRFSTAARLAFLAFVVVVTPSNVLAQGRTMKEDALGSDVQKLDAEVSRLRQLGRAAEALPLAEYAVETAEKQYGSDHTEVAAALLVLCEVLSGLGRASECEALEQRALAIRERTLGSDHPLTAEALVALAGTYSQLQRYDKEEALLERALAIYQRAEGAASVRSGDVLGYLARLRETQARHLEAETAYRRAFEIREAAFGPEDPQIVEALQWRALHLKKLGRLDEARIMFERCLRILEQAKGPDSAPVRLALYHLAEILRSLGRYVEADPFAARSVAISEKLRGKEHPEVAVGLNVVGMLHHHQARYVEADRAYRRALSILEAARGPDHLSLASVLSNAAELRAKQGQYKDAEYMARRAVQIAENAKAEEISLAARLSSLARVYVEAERDFEAEPILRRCIELFGRVRGPDHHEVATALNELSLVLRRTARPKDAEIASRRALDIYEATLGATHVKTATALGALAATLSETGRFNEAEALYKRSIAIFEATLGRKHPFWATAMNNLAWFYSHSDRLKEAEIAVETSMAVRDPNPREVLAPLSILSAIYLKQGRLHEAEPLMKRAIQLAESAHGTESASVAAHLNNLAKFYIDVERFSEAEPLQRRALHLWENIFGSANLYVAVALGNLAGILEGLGKHSEALAADERALAVALAAVGDAHPDVGMRLNNLAERDRKAGNFHEAEQRYLKAIDKYQRAYGPVHTEIARSLSNLALLYLEAGRHSDAEIFLDRAIRMFEVALGPEHPEVAYSHNIAAELHVAAKRWDAALDHSRRGVAILSSRADGTQMHVERLTTGSKEKNQRSRDVLIRFVLISQIVAAENPQVRPALAHESFTAAQSALQSEVSAALSQMALRGAMRDIGSQQLIRRRQDIVSEWKQLDARQLKAFSQPASHRNADTEAELRERLRVISGEVAEIDARIAMELPAYSSLTTPKTVSVEDAQNELNPNEALVLFLDTPKGRLLPETTFVWIVTKGEVRWIAAPAGTPTLKREVAALRCGLDATAWHGEGAKRCADHLNLPVGVAPGEGDSLPFDAARAHALYNSLLGEAADLIKGKHLLIVPSGPLTTLPFHVLVTSLPVGVEAGAIPRRVGRLGAKLGPLSDDDRMALPAGTAGGVRVVKPVPGGPAEAAGLRAGDLFIMVDARGFLTVPEAVAAVQAAGADRTVSLALVRDGQRIDLPVTLTAGTVTDWKPLFLDASNAPQVKWLGQENAITVLPSVASLKALRRIGKPSAAPKPMIGFANPLLDGNQAHPNPKYREYFKQQAQTARAQTGCATSSKTRTAALRMVSRSLDTAAVAGGALANLDHLRVQAPLPETADEVCDVVRAIGGSAEEMRIGARATETEVKRLSVSGDLAKYRILHFATHGTLAGQLKGTREPGLILTPPATATEDDDGYLSGSEIAALKLDADWVILSACNTAGGAGEGEAAEALSGLARVFFYAGARALLASHWEVDSDAAVKLVTGAMREMTHDKSIGRAEAMRRAMLAVMADTSRPKDWVPAWHPSVWAPFVVVGEGGAGR